MLIRRVQVENGWVRGLPAADPRITSYKGIPFAAPPVGENRWRAPQPCQDWEGDFLAYDFAPASMQAAPVIEESNVYTREWSIDPDLAMDEDCLYLNIWAPADGRTGLPVYVWYFGGGLQVGHTMEMEFDGERIARRGIVVVTVNYRLNAFGFLCHPEITAEAPEAPANFGFLDQQFATRWVKRNIAAFGGDPENITIGGQSAGGMSVSAQIAHKGNEGLFKRAIIQSGMFAQTYPSFFGLNISLREAEEKGKRFFEETLGVKTLAEARKVDAKTLLHRALSCGMWSAAADGVFLPRSSNDWYMEKNRVICPVMMGSTDSEFRLYPDAKDEESLRCFAEKTYGADAEQFLALFRHPATEQTIREDGEICNIDFAIDKAARLTAGEGMPIYAYQFAMDIPGWDNAGTFHSVDLWFFFETLAKCWRPFTGRHYDLARQMCDYWVNFIRTGDPNGVDSIGEELPYWPVYDPKKPIRMRFAQPMEAVAVPENPLHEFLLAHTP